MFNFEKIPPNQFTLLATLLGILLNLDLDVDEQNSFGNFLVSIGQSMLTSAAQASIQQTSRNKSLICQQIDLMSTQLETLRKQVEKGKY